MTDVSQMDRYKPEIGDNIGKTLKMVIAMVAETSKPVAFIHAWSGKDFIVQPGETAGDALARWKQVATDADNAARKAK